MLSCLSALQAALAGQWIAQMIVVAYEVSNFLFKITGQVIVLEQDAVLEG